MEWMLPLVLGALALFYICQPLLSGASQTKRQTNFEGWHSLEQLEIDRQLGKIDDAEFEELKKRVPEPTPVAVPGEHNLLERLILGRAARNGCKSRWKAKFSSRGRANAAKIDAFFNEKDVFPFFLSL
jgi:hypothetical protein